ncbi:MAG: Calx-beta domain-containing protein, partial [Pseudohongiellaceae bacterium]
TAEAGKDYTGISDAMLTFAPGELLMSVTVTVIDDAITEDSEDFTLTLSSPTNATLAVDASSAIGTITDDEMPTLSISATASSVVEGGNAVFEIESSNSPMADTDIGVMGVETGDFVTDPLPTRVTLAAFATTATFTVATVDDTADEPDGSLTMAFDLAATPAAYTATTASVVTVALADNDDPPTLTVTSPGVTEPANLVFDVSLAPASDKTATVDYETSDGSAIAPGDYTVAGGSLTFLPGETTKQVMVTVLDDDIVESLETLTLRFTNHDNIADTGFTGGELGATGSIADDEMPRLSITAVASPVPEGTVAVFVIASTHSPMEATDIGVAVVPTGEFAADALPTSVTLVANETTATLTVATLDDAVDEADGSLAVRLDLDSGLTSYTVDSDFAAVTVTIEDNDGPEVSVAAASADETDERLVFTVSLSATPIEQTEVTWATGTDPNAPDAMRARASVDPDALGADYVVGGGKLTFAADAVDLGLSVTVTLVDDAMVEPDETFLLTLSDPGNDATLAADASAAIGTIISDDAAFVAVDAASAGENENLVFAVTLSPVSYQTVVVNYATMDGTAKEGEDYTGISDGMLTFMPDASSGTITVFVTDDLITEGSEDLTLTLSDATNATIASGSTSVTGTITDNEMPALSIRASDSSVTEGSPAVFIITSTNSPMDDTEIGVAGTKTGEFFGSDALPTIVTLAAGETAATLRIATVGDDDDEANGSLAVWLDIDSGLSSYTATGASVATVTIKDDDGPEISVAAASANEAEGYIVFTVALSAMPTEHTEVSWNTGADTTPDAVPATAGSAPAAEGVDYITASGTLTFAAGTEVLRLSVTVTVVDDDDVEPDETFLLTLSAPGNDATLAAGASSATGTITSDDIPAVHITANQEAVSEGDMALFTVTADQKPLTDLTVGVNTTFTPDSFSLGTQPTTVTLAAGTTTAAYTVATQEVTGTGTGTITATVNDGGAAYTAVAPLSATVAILDNTTRLIDISGPAASVTEADNARAEFIVALSSPPASTGQTVRVSYATVDGTAITVSDYRAASGTLTFAGSETSKTVTVTVLNDTAYENPNERFQMQISNQRPITLNDLGATSA